MQHVLGKDLRAGDVWQGDYIESVSRDARMIPAKVLHESVARQHPAGVPGRTAILRTRNGARVPCTIFDNDRYQVERRKD